jgi:hypothetical protein
MLSSGRVVFHTYFVPMEEVWTPPALPPSPPQENPGRELFPIGQDPILPGAGHAEQLEAGWDKSDGLAEELLIATCRAMESAEVRCRPLAVLFFVSSWLHC